MPTSIWAYIGASVGAYPRSANWSASTSSTWLAMSLMRLANVPVPEAAWESRTRMRKPSLDSSTYCSRARAARSRRILGWPAFSATATRLSSRCISLSTTTA